MAGDDDSFNQLILRWERPIYALAYRTIGREEDARDIVQDTFLKLWTADHASVNGHLAAWLYRVCRNRALDVCRKEDRMTTLESEKLEIREAARPRREDAPPAEFGAVMEELACLPQKQQEAVRLNLLARRELRQLVTNVRDTVPAWRIIDPPAADVLLSAYQAAEAEFGAGHPVQLSRSRVRKLVVTSGRGGVGRWRIGLLRSAMAVSRFFVHTPFASP